MICIYHETEALFHLHEHQVLSLSPEAVSGWIRCLSAYGLGKEAAKSINHPMQLLEKDGNDQAYLEFLHLHLSQPPLFVFQFPPATPPKTIAT